LFAIDEDYLANAALRERMIRARLAQQAKQKRRASEFVV
jgi:hypothetical protein